MTQIETEMPENTPDMDDYDRNLRADSRLAALASLDILDTPEEREFDDIEFHPFFQRRNGADQLSRNHDLES